MARWYSLLSPVCRGVLHEMDLNRPVARCCTEQERVHSLGSLSGRRGRRYQEGRRIVRLPNSSRAGHVALLIGHTSRTIPDLDRRPYDVRDTEGVLAELLSQPEEVTYTGRSWDAVSFISSNRTGLARSAHLNS